MTYFFTLNQYGGSTKLTPLQTIRTLLPNQSGNSGKVLGTDGNNLSWVTGGGGGITSLNALTATVQTFSIGSAGSDFNIVSSVSNHTFNIPDAGVLSRGLVTNNIQTFGGAKTFNDQVTIGDGLVFNQNSNGASGTNADINVHPNTNIRLTNGALVSLASISISGVSTGHQLWLYNATGNSIILVNNYGSSPVGSRPILTTFGSNINIPNTATVILEYDSTASAWRLVGNVGIASASYAGYLSSTDWATFNNKQNALGYTPVPETRTITINGTAQDLSANRSWTVSVDPLTDLRTKGFYFDDFDVVGTNSSTAFFHNTLYNNYGGSWQTTVYSPIGQQAWGVVQVNTLNATASMGFGSNSFQYQTVLGGATFETRVRFEDLSTATDRFTYYSGFLAITTFNANNRIRFNYSDNINSGKFQIECNSGGVGTTADSGITVAADTWYVLKFVINSAANSVEFFINGVSVGTIATNIPSNTVFPFTQINRSTYVATRQIYVDYHFAQTTINR